MSRLWTSFAEPLWWCSSGLPHRASREAAGPGSIFVLSAHAAEDETTSHAAEEESMWSQLWEGLASLLPFSLEPARTKGGLCTQSLLAVMQRGLPEPLGSDAGRNPGAKSLEELLRLMHRVLSDAGFPTAILTLRSSVDFSGSGTPCCVAKALPSAQDCLGAPRALLVGICYLDQPGWRLEGSWNDVSDLRSWLSRSQAWPEEGLRALTDEVDHGGRRNMRPTRNNILRHLDWLLEDDGCAPSLDARGCKTNMRLLHFCGHGGLGEVYPVDWDTAGAISSTYLAQTVARRVRQGMTFTCILDCCESSTLFRTLQYKIQLPRQSN